MTSDTTTLWFKLKYYNWTYYLDILNNGIIDSDVKDSRHGNNTLDHREVLQVMHWIIKPPVEYKAQLGVP